MNARVLILVVFFSSNLFGQTSSERELNKSHRSIGKIMDSLAPTEKKVSKKKYSRELKKYKYKYRFYDDEFDTTKVSAQSIIPQKLELIIKDNWGNLLDSVPIRIRKSETLILDTVFSQNFEINLQSGDYSLIIRKPPFLKHPFTITNYGQKLNIYLGGLGTNIYLVYSKKRLDRQELEVIMQCILSSGNCSEGGLYFIIREI